MKSRPGDQPLPIVNDEPDIQSRVIADIEARRLVGIQRYGTALQPHNGRDALRDGYEEALDLACYLKQAIVERDGDQANEHDLADIMRAWQERDPHWYSRCAEWFRRNDLNSDHQPDLEGRGT